jgi:hypothetical protein
MTERSKVGEGAKSWDKIILGLSALTYLINVVVAGLDSVSRPEIGLHKNVSLWQRN